MKHNVIPTISSLLSILFFTVHLADDIVRGMEPGGLSNLIGGALIPVVWLYGTLVLTGRRSGYIIVLILSLLAVAIPFIHMSGKGVGVASGIANSSGGGFFVWTLIALAVTGLFSVILSGRELWRLFFNQPALDKTATQRPQDTQI